MRRAGRTRSYYRSNSGSIRSAVATTPVIWTLGYLDACPDDDVVARRQSTRGTIFTAQDPVPAECQNVLAGRECKEAQPATGASRGRAKGRSEEIGGRTDLCRRHRRRVQPRRKFRHNALPLGAGPQRWRRPHIRKIADSCSRPAPYVATVREELPREHDTRCARLADGLIVARRREPKLQLNEGEPHSRNICAGWPIACRRS